MRYMAGIHRIGSDLLIKNIQYWIIIGDILEQQAGTV